MAWTDYCLRLRALLFRRRMDEELDEELQFHLEMQARKKQRHELNPTEAKRQARLQFGSVARAAEECREARGLSSLETLLRDLRFGLRMLRKSPGFTAIALLTLALGIGANTAIFSIVNAILLRPLPVKDPAQLVTLSFQQPGGASTSLFSYPDYRDFREQSSSALSDVLAYRVGIDALSLNGQSDRVMVHYVTGNYFTLLGVQPALGRLFAPPEGEAPGADPVLVLGYSYWQTRFAADPGIIGKRVLIDGHPFTVIGVAARQFRSVQAVIDVQAYLPLGMVLVEGNYPREVLTMRNIRMFSLVARLRPGVSSQQARNALDLVAARLSQTYPKLLQGMTLDVQPESLGRLPLGGSRRLI